MLSKCSVVFAPQTWLSGMCLETGLIFLLTQSLLSSKKKMTCPKCQRDRDRAAEQGGTSGPWKCNAVLWFIILVMFSEASDIIAVFLFILWVVLIGSVIMERSCFSEGRSTLV